MPVSESWPPLAKFARKQRPLAAQCFHLSSTAHFGERCNMTKKKPGKTFGHFLREKRVAKGFSLRKFAEQVGISPTYLSQVEQDNVDPPTADRMKSMAESLGETVDYWTPLTPRFTTHHPPFIPP